MNLMSPRANQFIGMMTVVVVFSVAVSFYLESRSLPAGSSQFYMSIVFFGLGIFRLIKLIMSVKKAKARAAHMAQRPRREDFMQR